MKDRPRSVTLLIAAAASSYNVIHHQKQSEKEKKNILDQGELEFPYLRALRKRFTQTETTPHIEVPEAADPFLDGGATSGSN